VDFIDNESGDRNMDQRTVDLADTLAEEVHPEIGHYVLTLAEEGLSYEEIMDKFRSIISIAAELREKDKA